MVTVKGGRTRWPATVVVVVVVVENETNRRGNDIGEATSSVLVLATVKCNGGKSDTWEVDEKVLVLMVPADRRQ